jgi:hypothetical protein
MKSKFIPPRSALVPERSNFEHPQRDPTSKKVILRIMAIMLLILGTLAVCSVRAQTTIYVAIDGNDAWSGRMPVIPPSNNDGPVASMTQAIKLARASRGTKPETGVTIKLRNGTHFLSEPLKLGPDDSFLTIGAYQTETPVLSGGRKINDWKPATISSNKVLVADVPWVRTNAVPFRELWVNNKRAARARHPDKGYLPVAALPDATADWEKGHSRFQYATNDLQAWPGITNAEMVVMTRWVESRLPIMGLDPTQRLVSFSKRSMFQLAPGDLYYVEGALEFLNQPGEWTLDVAAAKLYYVPRPGESAANLEAIVPNLSELIRIEGETNRIVDNLHLQGLTFSHAEWYYPPSSGANKPGAALEVGGFAQAAVGVPGAIVAHNLRNSIIEKCRFIHLGNYALELGQGCQTNTVKDCVFYDLGAGGIKIGETGIPAVNVVGGNIVTNCAIHDGGKVFASGEGIWIGQSPGNRLVNNSIYDFFYTGISIGWTWGYGPAASSNNLVAFNKVHHIGAKADGDGPILSDMGGIYTLGKQPGTTIMNNVWHDMSGIRYGGWGIYLDEGSSGITVASNLVYRTTHGGFHQHYGETNLIKNNVFALGRDQQLQFSRKEEHRSFSLVTNIVFFDKGALQSGEWLNGQVLVDWNLYFDTRISNPAWFNVTPQTTFAKWQESGHDQHSVFADPGFVDYSKNDWRLKTNSPAFALGFKQFDLSHAGAHLPSEE